MPRIQFLGRHIDMATDDLYMPSVVSLVFHSIFFGLAVSAFVYTRSGMCDKILQLDIYLLLHLITMGLLILLDWNILLLSLQGTITKPGPRVYIMYLLPLHFFLHSLDLGTTLFGYWVLYLPEPLQCPNISWDKSIGLIKILLIWGIVILTIGLLFWVTLFVNGRHKRIDFHLDDYISEWTQSLERIIQRFIGPNMTQEAEVSTALSEVAAILAEFFQDAPDWAPSDLVVGLILLKREQKLRMIEAEKKPPPAQQKSFTQASTAISTPPPSILPLTLPPPPQITINEEDFFLKTPASSANVTICPSNDDVDDDEGGEEEEEDEMYLASHAYGPSFTTDINKSPPSASSEGSSHHIGSNRTFSIGEHEDFNPDHFTRLGLSSIAADSDGGQSVGEKNVKGFANAAAQIAKAIKDEGETIISPESHKPPSSAAPGPESESGDVSLQELQSSRTRKRSKRRFLHRMMQQRALQRKVLEQAEVYIHPHLALSNTSLLTPVGTTAQTTRGVYYDEVADLLHYAKYAELVYENPKTILKMSDGQILAHEPEVKLFRTPYLIVADEAKKSIVVAVRGTYSPFDVMTDLNVKIEAIKLPEFGFGDTPLFVHAGMWETAGRIRLETINTLRKVFMDTSAYRNWQLVVCGHSLGAGVAALLCMRLRATYENAKCYCYEPPGCVVDPILAQYFTTFCETTVMGDDLVPRLSLPALDKFRRDLYRVLTTCPLPKYQVLGSSIANYFRLTTRPLQALYASLPHRPDPSIPFDDKPSVDLPDMRIPGRILYLVKERDSPYFDLDILEHQVGLKSTLCFWSKSARDKQKELKKYVYAPRWALNEEFMGVSVSWSMISDHFCFPVLKRLRESPSDRILTSVSSTNPPRKVRHSLTRSKMLKQATASEEPFEVGDDNV